jgi:hypothetical protein
MKNITILACLFGFMLIMKGCLTEEIEKRPSWSVGRSIENSDEVYENELLPQLNKRPSWSPGRSIEKDDFQKRLIEFKRNNINDLQAFDKYEYFLNRLKNYGGNGFKMNKRPSIGRIRSIVQSSNK